MLGLYRDNGKENGNYYSIMGYILGLYGDNGKENGSYYSIMVYTFEILEFPGLRFRAKVPVNIAFVTGLLLRNLD